MDNEGEDADESVRLSLEILTEDYQHILERKELEKLREGLGSDD